MANKHTCSLTQLKSDSSEVYGLVFARLLCGVSPLALAFAGQQEHGDTGAGVEGQRRPRHAVRAAEMYAGVDRKPAGKVAAGVLERVAEYFDTDEHRRRCTPTTTHRQRLKKL